MVPRALSTVPRAYSTSLHGPPPPTLHGHHFYRNKIVERYANQKSFPISLRQLLFFGRHIDKDRIIRGANFVRSELPVRIAHRIRDLQHLPFVVGTHPSLASVYSLYVDAFEKIRRYPPITSLEENDNFCDFMKSLLSDHLVVIPRLAVAIAESATHLPPEELDAFMTRMLRSRISRRVVTEHHIALSSQFRSRATSSRSHERFVGVVDSELNVCELIEKCAELAKTSDSLNSATRESTADVVDVQIEGNTDMSFAYIPDHLEYMVFELLKNARRATLEQPIEKRMPIKVTLVFGPRDLMVRISDRGGGMQLKHPIPSKLTAAESDVFSFLYPCSTTTASGRESLGNLKSIQKLGGTVREQVVEDSRHLHASTSMPRLHHERLGIGLPLSRIYANYFGGHLEVYNMPGTGVDAYLRIPKLGTQLESSQ